MATLTPTSAINALSQVIEESLDRGVRDSLPGLDSLFHGLFTTSMGVRQIGGRQLEVIHSMRDSISGAMEWVDPLGPTPMADIVHSVHHNLETYPGLRDASTPGHLQMKVQLAKGMGNMFVPQEYLTIAASPESIADPVQEIVAGTAQNDALAEIQAWYSRTTLKEIAVIPTAGVSFANNRGTDDRATIVVSGSSIRNFYNGLQVDILDTTGATRRNESGGARLECVIDGVRYLPDTTNDSGGYGAVIVQSTAASAQNLNSGGVVATDIIVRANSVSKGPLGPEQWLISTGTVFNINVATHQQFQSIRFDASGAPLTDILLSRLFGRFRMAYGMSDMPDTIVTSPGVTNAHVENSDGLQRFERLGKPFVIADGFNIGDIPFVYNGRRCNWHDTEFMPSLSDVTAASPAGGRLWALKLRDQNISRYVAPLAASTRAHDDFPTNVQFLFPIGGPGGIFKPYTATGVAATAGRATNMSEAPHFMYRAFAPRFMPGILMFGLAELL